MRMRAFMIHVGFGPLCALTEKVQTYKNRRALCYPFDRERDDTKKERRIDDAGDEIRQTRMLIKTNTRTPSSVWLGDGDGDGGGVVRTYMPHATSIDRWLETG